MKHLSVIVLEKAIQLKSEVEAMVTQQRERMNLLSIYMNLVEKTVSKNTSGEAFEIVLEELIERHNRLQVLVTGKTEITASELIVANQFDKLFKLREVSAILKQINVVNSSMTTYAFTLQTEMVSVIKAFCAEHSIDITELRDYFPEYFTEYIN